MYVYECVYVCVCVRAHARAHYTPNPNKKYSNRIKTHDSEFHDVDPPVT